MIIAICDDEKIIAHDLKKRTSCLYNEKGVDCSIDTMTDPSSLLINDRTGYDVVFLDVDMGRWNGIDVARHLRQYDAGLIIVYISAHIKYSPLGYKVNAFRYLLKNELDDTLEDCLDDLYREHLSRPESLTIKHGVVSVNLKLEDISYIESQRAVMLFHVINNDDEIYKSYDTMQSMESRLTPKGFLRVQKSYIVNLVHVKHIKNYQVILKNGFIIQASRHDFQNLQREFMLWKGR